MKVLIVEDQQDKCDDITSYFKETVKKNIDVSFKHVLSLRSGLMAIMKDPKYDLLILDMSMPNFDPSPDHPQGSGPKSFAGKELMAQMHIRGATIPTIVITQHTNFEDGTVDLKSLIEDLSENFSDFFVGGVFYSSVSAEWKSDLSKLLEKI